MLIAGDQTVKCITAIKLLYLYLNLGLSIELDSRSYSFTSIPFLTNSHYCIALVMTKFDTFKYLFHKIQKHILPVENT